MSEQIYVPAGGSPRVSPPSRDIYGRMGEANIYLMMADFYGELEQSTIRGMFPEDMEEASRKSAKFFIGILGGPPLYQMEYGSPMMRGRHMPFAIDEVARQVWLDCFMRTLDHSVDKYDFPEEHLAGFRAFLVGFSAWMVNKKTEIGDG